MTAHSANQSGHFSNTPAPDLSLVLTCHNESDIIETVIREWVDTLSQTVPDFEIIAINDGSIDGTGRILDKLRKEFKSLRVVHQLQSGLARGARRGCENARGDYVLIIPADGTVDPLDFVRMWEMRHQKAAVLAYRTHRLDRFLSRMFAFCLRGFGRTLFGTDVADPNMSFRIYKRSTLLEFLHTLPEIAAIHPALAFLMKRDMPWAVAEIPVPYKARQNPKKRVGMTRLFSDAYQFSSELLKLRLGLISLEIPNTYRPPLAN